MKRNILRLLVILPAILLSCKNDKTYSKKNTSEIEVSDVKILILKERGYQNFPNIFHHENLEHLDLSNNSISEIPEEIIKLKKLKKLYLSENNIKIIPGYISKLSNLTTLYLLHNKVEIVSPDICLMENLRVLNLNGNPNNDIPKCLENTSKIILHKQTKMD